MIPSFAELKRKARAVFNMYGSVGAYHRAMNGKYASNEMKVPAGTTWVAPPTESSSTVQAPKSTNIPGDFKGDHVLAQTCRFLYDATISWETMLAIAEGHIGRVWECLKVSQTHKPIKYSKRLTYNPR